MTETGSDPSPALVRLRIEDSGDSRIIEANPAEPLVIGRAEECGVRLATSRCSRLHAEILREGDRLVVLDRGSSNGTRLNETPVTRAYLRRGDVIRIGEARVTVLAWPVVEAEPFVFSPDPAVPAELPVFFGPLDPFVVQVPPVPLVSLSRERFEMIPVALAIYVLGVLAAAFMLTIYVEWTDAIPRVRIAYLERPAAAPPAESVRPAPAAVRAVADDCADTRAVHEVARRDTPPDGRGTPAEGAVERLVAERRFGTAVRLCRVLAASDPEAREAWEGRAEAVERTAQAEFEETEGRLSELTGAGKTGEALQVLLEARESYGGTAAYEALLPRYLAAALSPSEPPPAEPPSAEEQALSDRAAIAFDACRFREVEAINWRLAALRPAPESRSEVFSALVTATYLERMFRQFRDQAAENEIEVSLSGRFPGRVTTADADGVTYELDVGGRRGAYRNTKRWEEIPAFTKFELFRGVQLDTPGLLGLVAFGFAIGNDEGARELLVNLHRREQARELADAYFSLHSGQAVPEGGFVEYDGRLVTPEARQGAIARRKALEVEEKAAREELALLKSTARLDGYVQLAVRLRTKGSFQLAHTVLTRLAGAFPAADAGKEALRLRDDSVLAEVPLLRTGSSENRLDIYLLGEGYPLEDDHQAAFLAAARATLRRLLVAEPFRTYRSYLTISAVHLASRERGVDREPGGVSRDSVLDGSVEWDCFTVEPAPVRAILTKLGPRAEGGCAIVIGNDYAGVATAGVGTGIACLPKTSLASVVHELGHSLGGLRDEYDTEPGTDPRRRGTITREKSVPVEPLGPNLIKGSDRAAVLARAPWRHWIEAGRDRWWNGLEVSAYEGGNHTPFNVWRPQVRCTMRTSGTRFCVVCMEQMVRAIYRKVRPIDRVEPAEDAIELDGDAVRTVRVWPLKPETHFLRAAWTIVPLAEDAERTETSEPARPFTRVLRQFDPEGRVIEAARLSGRELGPGRHRLRVTVHDPTPWVLRDEEKLLTQTRDWIVTVR